jgi:hypothetical protein
MTINRIDQLAVLLRRKERAEAGHRRGTAMAMTMNMGGERIAKELQTQQRRFKEEVPREKRVEVKLEDPLLLLLAQHRSFPICRRKPFCPDEHCRSKKIATFGRLATHLQLARSIEGGHCRHSQIFHSKATTKANENDCQDENK